MIEKFSDEELKQILSELGISGERSIRKSSVPKTSAMCEKKANTIRKFGSKPIDVHNHIMKIIDYSLNNFDYSNVSRKYRANTTIKGKDMSEYLEMYDEICKIIEQHNRQWESDNE